MAISPTMSNAARGTGQKILARWTKSSQLSRIIASNLQYNLKISKRFQCYIYLYLFLRQFCCARKAGKFASKLGNGKQQITKKSRYFELFREINV